MVGIKAVDPENNPTPWRTSLRPGPARCKKLASRSCFDMLRSPPTICPVHKDVRHDVEMTRVRIKQSSASNRRLDQMNHRLTSHTQMMFHPAIVCWPWCMPRRETSSRRVHNLINAPVRLITAIWLSLSGLDWIYFYCGVT